MRLPGRDLADVVHGKRDPAPVLVEGHLPAVRTCPQRALGQLFEPQAAEDLRRLRG